MSDKSRKSKKADEMADEVPLEATDDILAEDIAEAEAETKAEDKAESEAKSSKKDAEAGTEKKEKAPKNHFKWSDVDPIIAVSFVVFLLACVIVIGATVVDKTVADHTEPNAEYGDEVVVNYTGSFYAYYDQDGAMIFDTSLSGVGEDPKYTKSWEFNRTSYATITVTIGSGSYLAMFEDALIGHHPGETVQVLIPAAEAYGLLTDSDIGSLSLTAGSVPAVQTFTAADYKTFFELDAPSAGSAPAYVVSPYGWTAVAVTNTDGTVTVNYIPEVDDYTLNEYVTLKVTAIDDVISFTYVISGADSGYLIRTIVDGQYVYITEFDDEEFSYKTTDEEIGMDLYFTIVLESYAEEES